MSFQTLAGASTESARGWQVYRTLPSNGILVAIAARDSSITTDDRDLVPHEAEARMRASLLHNFKKYRPVLHAALGVCVSAIA